MNESTTSSLYQTASYFVTSKWGLVFALGIALVLCYCLFCVIRFVIRRINEARLRKNLTDNYRRELERVRQSTRNDMVR